MNELTSSLAAHWRSAIGRVRGWRDFDFYLDPACNSGIGDRLIEIWAALTIAEILKPGAKTAIRWRDSGFRTPAFVTEYAPLFEIGSARFVTVRPLGASKVQTGYSLEPIETRYVHRIPFGMRQIQLKYGRYFGLADPRALIGEAGDYGLPPETGLADIVAVYRRIAADTRPVTDVKRLIPADMDQRVGIHIRLSDKLVSADEEGHTMSVERWKAIETAALAHIDRAVADGERFFVCSEDFAYRDRIVDRIRGAGGDAIVCDPPPASDHRKGFGAQVDFFALARCRRIVQMTRFSHFSLMPAVISSCEIVNFDPLGEKEESYMDRWSDVANIRWAARSAPAPGRSISAPTP